jgi:hypothetical protein
MKNKEKERHTQELMGPWSLSMIKVWIYVTLKNLINVIDINEGDQHSLW